MNQSERQAYGLRFVSLHALEASQTGRCANVRGGFSLTARSLAGVRYPVSVVPSEPIP